MPLGGDVAAVLAVSDSVSEGKDSGYCSGKFARDMSLRLQAAGGPS
jgi:hypothetical protein